MSAFEDFADLCLLSVRTQTLRKVVFSGPLGEEPVRATGVLRRIGGDTRLQIEVTHRDRKVTHENLSADEKGAARLSELCREFSFANLLTPAGDAELRRNKKGVPALLSADRLRRRLLSPAGGTAAVPVPPNDRVKQHVLTGGEPFLRLLGVSDENGRVYDKKGPKFRQINRFLELIRDTLPHLPEKKIRICDLCCGKSYLSFAVYYYFSGILGMEVSMTGVDLKADVIAECNGIARELHFDGLTFLAGDVAAYESEIPPDLVVSLHACDTATDLVLEKALGWHARVILSTPCCHHELNHRISCPPLAFLTEHSMLRQKFCDAATDALRLKWLEAHGYEVAALELIDPDDTPKNIMLRALRRPDADADGPAREKALAEYRAARAFLLGGPC